MQMADGVDDPTWLYHLKRHDYSRWMSEAIKDDDLAGEVRDAEAISDPGRSRQRVRDAIERRYTTPASSATEKGHEGAVRAEFHLFRNGSRHGSLNWSRQRLRGRSGFMRSNSMISHGRTDRAGSDAIAYADGPRLERQVSEHRCRRGESPSENGLPRQRPMQ